ncbi:hypothetical protein M3Y94_01066500 [Aphelenchoides besseyi]|nr:hypothetical protein M3Y94_01066500 [Aphelenchoides besseyi]KAI6216408.1 hypothetical protein M3Y95_01277400 [Aphelenchoides besseyi]
MAFYFALFNVSNVNQELRGQRKAREQKAKERRRHSLATAGGGHSSKDYRLLSRPKIVLHDPESDTLTTSLDDTTDDSISISFQQSKEMSTTAMAYRRASSPEANFHRRNQIVMGKSEVSKMRNQLAVGQTSLPEVQNHSKRVKFNNQTASRERLEKSLFNETEVWIRRDTSGQLEPPNDNPWVYSIDLNQRNVEAQRRRSNSSSGTDDRRTSASLSTEALLGPLEQLNTTDQTANSHVWRRRSCAMGVSGLELRPTTSNGNLASDEERRLQEDLRRHVNTWPEARGKSRWRPTSLIRRHSGGTVVDFASMFQRSKRPPPYRSMTAASSPAADELPPPPPMETTKTINQTETKKPIQRPLVITPTDRRANPSVATLRGGLSALAAQMAVRSRPPTNDSRLPFVRLDDSAAVATSPSASMIQSSVF